MHGSQVYTASSHPTTTLLTGELTTAYSVLRTSDLQFVKWYDLCPAHSSMEAKPIMTTPVQGFGVRFRCFERMPPPPSYTANVLYDVRNCVLRVFQAFLNRADHSLHKYRCVRGVGQCTVLHSP